MQAPPPRVAQAPPPRVAICAGEASGDLLAANFARNLLRARPQCRVFGVGGKALAAAGAQPLIDGAPLAVMGLLDALRNLPAILGVRRRLFAQLAQTPPALFVGVDAPDFNLPAARRAKRAGIKTAQYVAPSVWMWRRRRLAKISAAVDAVWCLLPFEPPIYAAAGIRACFVGHPAAARRLPPRAAARANAGAADADKVIALLPGSRADELRRHLPLCAAVAKRLRGKGAVFVTAAANERGKKQICAALPQAKILPFEELLAAADVAVATSGTAVLELALANVPVVAMYRLPPPLAFMARLRKFYLPYFCLPNILLRRFVVPELLLDEATPERLAAEASRLLSTPAAAAAMRENFAKIRQMLSSPPTTPAQAALALLEE